MLKCSSWSNVKTGLGHFYTVFYTVCSTQMVQQKFKKNQWTKNSVIWKLKGLMKNKVVVWAVTRLILEILRLTSLIFTLLNANSKVFHGKYFIQNQCQNSLIFILLLFQLRFFVRHFLIQKIAAPEIYWFLWSKECSIY